jgi:hypothetical protein
VAREPRVGDEHTPTAPGREFVTAMRVADALATFQPTHRTAVEQAASAEALGPVPSAAGRPPPPLPRGGGGPPGPAELWRTVP